MPPYLQTIAVRFRDIDALDHVNHAVIATYCETVRCDWFALHGWTSMANLPFIIASLHVEYKAPIPKTANLQIAVTVPRIGGKSWEFDYELKDATSGVLYATAKTIQVAYDYKAKATVALEGPLRAKLEALTPA
ncbi:MAG: thioesterase family protein [Candidatus Thermoplasmatota archaeon]